MAKICKKEYVTPRGVSSTVTADATALRFTFTNGNSHEVSLDMFQPQIQACSQWHGTSQKLGDSYASALTADDAEARFLEMLNQLKAGDWNTRSEGGAGIADLAEAVHRCEKVSVKKATEKLLALDAEKLKAIKKNPRIVAALAAIKAERATAKAEGDTSDLSELLS